jgi:radical SAM superfamily enzyme YgiQ (UPF0313 family)
MYLHEYLKVNGVKVKIIDLAGKKRWEIPTDGDYYGISATTPQYPLALVAKAKIRGMNPQALIILGGVHATALVDDCYNDGFDQIIAGEGEKKLLFLIGEEVPEEDHIDSFPHPKLESIENYTSKMTYNFQGKIEEKECGWMITSRGCPHKCSFCASQCMWHGKVRFHGIQYLRDWIDYYRERGINNFHFVDEQMVYGKNRLARICELLKETGGYWRCAARGDSMTYEKAEMMYDSGCRQITFGVETGSQRLLDLINKGEKVEDNEKAIEMCRRVGIGVKASLMVGLPTETQEDIDLTKALLERTQPDETQVAIFVPYAGCDIYHNPEKYGYKLNKSMDFTNYVGAGKDPYTPVLDEGREETVHNYKKQLLNVVGEKYVLSTLKERWESWR